MSGLVQESLSKLSQLASVNMRKNVTPLLEATALAHSLIRDFKIQRGGR